MAGNNANALPQGYQLHSTAGAVYTVRKMIGSGGCGITYLVTTPIQVKNINIDAEFVVKEYFHSTCCIRDHNTQMVSCTEGGREMVERGLHDFVTEAERLYNICGKNPNIVKVNEVFRANGTAYYVMEYLDGGDLSQYCVRHGGNLSESEALHFMSAVCNAVDFLHVNRLLHLDIKPQNVVLRTDIKTREQTPVLIDFGLTRHFDKKGNPTTNSEMKSHTDGYAPVEQYVGIKSFAPTADVYALGALLFYLLTGKDPIVSSDMSMRYLNENLPANISESTRSAIQQAMQSSPHDRTASVADFARNLGIELDTVVVIDDTSNDTKTADSKKPKVKKEKKVKDPSPLVVWLKKQWYLFVVGAAIVGLVFWFIGKGGFGEKKEKKAEYAQCTVDIKRVMDNEESRKNVDSLLYARERLDERGRVETILREVYDVGYREIPTDSYDSLLNESIDTLFNELVSSAENTSINSVKVRCLGLALRLKRDIYVERKLVELESANINY
ncbi:MAG: serine/threonine protein kinase [Bacteroidales bacterium]|nr:serine/threonine protein kinase [Bacteroidales bacterium]